MTPRQTTAAWRLASGILLLSAAACGGDGPSEPRFEALSITTSTLPSGTVGVAYGAALSATGGDGDYTWSVSAGSRPPGLTLTESATVQGGAVLDGLPQTAGSFTFTVRVTSGDGQTATRSYTVDIAAPPLEIVTTSLPGGTVGEGYSAAAEAEGGASGYTWAVAEGSLPPGIALSQNATTGDAILSGVPELAGSYTFTLRVTSGDGQTATAAYTVEIAPAPLVITTMSLPQGAVGVTYTAGVNADGGDGAYSWDLAGGTLPPGLDIEVEDLSDDDVVITGVPETEGTFAFTLRVMSEDGQTATQALSITIVAAGEAVELTRALLPPGLVGGPYEAPLRAEGGSGSFTWTVESGSLPPGLGLTSAGVIQGTPSTTGTFGFTIRAASGGVSGARSYTVEVFANQTNGYQISPVRVVDVPDDIEPHLEAAIAQWEAVITADLQPVAIPVDFFTGDVCGGFGDAANGTATDDIIILVNIRSIDGPEQIVAQAGPCALRSNDLPAVGVLTLDADDLDAITGSETLTEVIVHEIGHVLGFGTLWASQGLITGAGTESSAFTGPQAVAEYEALGGTGSVPLEDTGGEGTADAHWEEDVFDEEVMTGFVEQVGIEQPLSRMSIASLADLGYTVDLSVAEDFTLGGTTAGLSAAVWPRPHLGYDELYDGPVLTLPAWAEGREGVR